MYAEWWRRNDSSGLMGQGLNSSGEKGLASSGGKGGSYRRWPSSRALLGESVKVTGHSNLVQHCQSCLLYSSVSVFWPHLRNLIECRI